MIIHTHSIFPPFPRYPWYGQIQLVEPHRVTTLSIANELLDLEDADEEYKYTWKLDITGAASSSSSSSSLLYAASPPVVDHATSSESSGDDDDDEESGWLSLSGSSVTAAFNGTGTRTVVVTAWVWTETCDEEDDASDDGNDDDDNDDSFSCTAYWKAHGTGTSAVLALYVRRELRSLTAADRRAFFDAAEVLFRVPRAVGRRDRGYSGECVECLLSACVRELS